MTFVEENTKQICNITNQDFANQDPYPLNNASQFFCEGKDEDNFDITNKAEQEETVNRENNNIQNSNTENDNIKSNNTKSQQQRPPQRPDTPASLSAEIYLQMRTLGVYYQNLQKFNTPYQNELKEMENELNILTLAMLRIHQSLSKTTQNLDARQIQPQTFKDFCSGVKYTSNHLRRILFDLRRLQRMVENTNISLQLLIINVSLMAQQEQLSQMATNCNS